MEDVLSPGVFDLDRRVQALGFRSDGLSDREKAFLGFAVTMSRGCEP